MFKRYYIIICAFIILLLFISCEKKSETPVEQPDGTFLWNGLQLIRDDLCRYDGRGISVFVPENVITTEEKMLTVFFRDYSGGLEYGVKEYIQVYINGLWYTVNQQVSQYDESLILYGYQGDRGDYRSWQGEKYTADFSAMDKLPVGKYRFVETFSGDRLEEEIYAFANFWVIKPGGKRPPESETTGNARKEDIVLSMQSVYEARREITDKDIWFCVFVENLSGKEYCIDNEQEKNPPILEIKQNSKWEKVDYRHINAGVAEGWQININQIFLDELLTAGHYRIRIPMRVFKEPGSIEKQPGYIEINCEFDIIAHIDIPEPKWEISRLKQSDYDSSKQSTGIRMSAPNPVLNKENTQLEIMLEVDNYYEYGTPYEVEVLLDGNWYNVPFMGGMGWAMPAFLLKPNDENTRNYIYENPVRDCGVLPKGQYRIIKEFDLREPPVPPAEWGGNRIAKEFAIVEFTVEETLSSEEYYIEMMSKSYE